MRIFRQTTRIILCTTLILLYTSCFQQKNKPHPRQKVKKRKSNLKKKLKELQDKEDIEEKEKNLDLKK